MIQHVASAPPSTWVGDRIDRLGRALSSFTEGGHLISLQLSAALLNRGTAPEAVPAIVDAATSRAGWNAPVPGHYHRNATDTVHKWASGAPVRADVPLELVPVLDAVTGSIPARAADLPTEQARLADALRHAPDGLSCVRAPCGLGKTHAARLIAAERAAEGQRTTISVPTNELAIQVTEDLRAAGVAVRRVFGPTSVRGEHNGFACAFRGAAVHLSNGWQSVRWELCEGRRRDPCPHRQTCPAADGCEGPEDALVTVGNHGLLSELDRVAGVRGLMVIDEPPTVLEDHVLTDDDLVEALDQLSKFDKPHLLAPAVHLARAWLEQAPLDSPSFLADADPSVPGLEDLLERAGAYDVAEAIADVIPDNGRAPQIDRLQLITTRTDPTRAGRLGRASRVLTVLHRALTDSSARATVFEAFRSKERRLGVVAVERQLAQALRRDGSVVVTAADAHLWVKHYADVVGYEPPLVHLSAPDGCAVRRVLLERANSRTKRPPATVIDEALALVTGRAAIVTHKAWTGWVRKHAPNVDVGHFGALRGLDHWKGHDALITIGDPIPNLAAVARATDADVHARAVDLARAELEQAHGRLRVVHRSAPATQIHVGRLVPYGWPQDFERHRAKVGRPARQNVPKEVVQAAVAAAGSARALGRRYRVSHTTVRRWLRGEAAPPSEVAASLRDAAQGGVNRQAAK